jgi:hypothetical protein
MLARLSLGVIPWEPENRRKYSLIPVMLLILFSTSTLLAMTDQSEAKKMSFDGAKSS